VGEVIEMMAEMQWKEQYWQAILRNDAAYDQLFFYAVTSTGIFCRPSCRSRIPKREHVRLFDSAEQALAGHFRPCKRCKPTGDRVPIEEWVHQIKQYIDHHYKESLTLPSLADQCHGSPYHLQRTFKRVMGMTPNQYIQQVRLNKGVELLRLTNQPVAEVALTVGIPNVPYFVTLFKRFTGLTPSEFRYQNREVRSNGEKGNV
jgi:AraC family transcriptional regulator of adaptative response / methylphosphotriester-DNA alkyltransferase methyltransferase